MAKGQKFGGKLKTRTVGGVKGKRPELPQSKPSNADADKKAQLIFVAVSITALLLVLGGLFWSVSMLINGVSGGFAHAHWAAVILGGITLGITIFLARSLAWLSYFAAIMYAARAQAWESLERLCRSALKRWRIFPGGASTAALMLVQSLVGRGEFDEAIAVGEEQYKLHGEDPKFSQSLSPMYTSLGMAFQVKGDSRQSLIWTERGIEAMQKALDELAERKSWQAKLAGPQAAEWTKSLRMQLCVAYFNTANCYFQQNNYRQAKQFYKLAIDTTNQAPDFPEKADIVNVSREQLSRLKHA